MCIRDSQVGVRLLGSRKIGGDGYVIDFGDIKSVTKKVCKDLNEHFLCPMLSNAINISTETRTRMSAIGKGTQETVKLVCEDGSIFLFPRQDCVMLPLVHATAEELAIYLWRNILNGLNATFLKNRGIHAMEVTVAEAPGQDATFRHEIPDIIGDEFSWDVRTFIESAEVVPTPCLSASSNKKSDCDGSCQASMKIFSEKLQLLAESINFRKLEANQGNITAEDLAKMIQ